MRPVSLTARINQFLGRAAVARSEIRLRRLRTPAPARACASRRHPVRESDPANAYAGPDQLRLALQHLARWRESGKN